MKTANRSIDEGLVLHLPLTEGAGSKVYDRSQYGNHGDITFGAGGEAAFWANAYLGKPVATFDGVADKINLDTSIDEDEGTLSVSIYLDQIASVRGARQIITAPLYLHDANNYFYFGSDDYMYQNIIQPTTVYTISHRWTGNTIEVSDIHINHDLLNTPAQQGGSWGLLGDINTFGNAGGKYLLGRLWDIRVYDRWLSDQEIRTLADMRRRI